MKRVAGLVFLCAMFAVTASARSAAVQVTEAKFGKGIQDRMITEETTTFAVGERMYLWLKLTGGPSDPITVAWKIGDTVDKVNLNVGGDPWRTWSSRNAVKAGAWTVTVSDAAGATLKELTVTVK